MIIKKIKNFFKRLRIFLIPKFFWVLYIVRNKFPKTNFFKSKILKVEKKLIDEILIYEEVLSYPLARSLVQDTEYTKYSGGLINTKTYQLIAEAVHTDEGNYCQELPTFNFHELAHKKISELKYPLLFGGILFNNFGHFLLESLSRLWAYDFVREIDPYILFYTPYGYPDYLDKNNYINQVLTGFGIPLKRIVFINQLVKIDKVLIPIQKYGHGYLTNPDAIFLNFIRSFRFKHDTPKGFENADKIYVSRSKMPIDSGKPIAENLFEEYLLSNGYKVFYPEKFSLYQQLTVYHNAKKIIFCDGGAIHTCILLADLQADIAIIVRRRDPRWSGRFMAEQFEGYGKSVLWIDEVSGQYQFGRETWDALSSVNWYKVSISLENERFVNTRFNSFNQTEYSNLAKYELKKYIQKLSNSNNNDSFIEFMMGIKEDYPKIIKR